MISKPFDPSKPCQTRDGRKVKILRTDLVGNYPICLCHCLRSCDHGTGDTQMSELKPCPFCGGEAQLIEDEDLGSWVRCRACGVDNLAQERETAIAAWNRRAEPDDNQPKGGDANATVEPRHSDKASPRVTAGASTVINRLQAWAPLVASGYECPAAGTTMTEAVAEIQSLTEALRIAREALTKISNAPLIPTRTDRDLGFNDARLAAYLISKGALAAIDKALKEPKA